MCDADVVLSVWMCDADFDIILGGILEVLRGFLAKMKDSGGPGWWCTAHGGRI